MPEASETVYPQSEVIKNGLFEKYTTQATTANLPGADVSHFAKQDAASVAKAKADVLGVFSLVGKTAIITGASIERGIGMEIAKSYAAAGANVIIWYGSKAKPAQENAAKIVETYGVACQAFQVNIRDAEAVEKAIYEQIQLPGFNGRLDIFVANAGIPWTKGDMTGGSDKKVADGLRAEQIKHYHDVVGTDLDAVFYAARACGQIWRAQKAAQKADKAKFPGFIAGSFVATASMSGHIVNFPQLQGAYNAAKAGVIHLCRSLSVEWIGFARANTISPGYMATEISNFIPQETKDIWRSKIPMGREGEVRELAGAYLYFASDASTYTTGTDLIVDGGYCAP